MDWNTPDLNSWPAKLVIRVGKKLRSNKKFTQETINKNNAREAARRERRRQAHAQQNHYSLRHAQGNGQDGINELGERESSIFSEADTLVGQPNKDHTDMLHRLAHHGSFDSLVDQLVGDPAKNLESRMDDEVTLRRVSTAHEEMIDCLPAEIWRAIATYLRPSDAACLAFASKTLHRKIGPTSLMELSRPENKHDKIAFLHHMDRKLPRHLLCFACVQYHLRNDPGNETLKADYNNNPLVTCRNSRNVYLPRVRLCHGRELPYGFVQLALRHSAHSELHGIHPESLSRRWKCKDSGWAHRTRYMVHDSRLLIRVVSQVFAPPAVTMTETSERHLLYDREEYMPYFSACSHFRDGELMKICKCALSHVPAPPESYFSQLKKAPRISRSLANPNFIVRGCDFCRPARRCPECPTEYLIEIRMTEDKQDSIHPFKHALVVTRWSDLGDGSNPHLSPEWSAIKGTTTASSADVGGGQYESFSHVGRRAVSGVFESHISGSIPGQRMLSLNPSNKKLGIEGHGWY